METNLLSEWAFHRELFPHIPSQSRSNRRRRALMHGFNLVRQVVVVLRVLDVAQDRQCCIDSLPVPVVQFHLVPSASKEWAINGAVFGRLSSKKQVIFGYKMQLLVTLGGVILDFALVPANITITDLQGGYELLEEHINLDAVADKGYISQPVAQALGEGNAVCLMTVPRANQKRQLPCGLAECINRVRQIAETVNGQLLDQLNLQHNHAHTFRGLCTRLYTKLTAHTLCIYINRLLGKAHFLQIKDLAFPI